MMHADQRTEHTTGRTGASGGEDPKLSGEAHGGPSCLTQPQALAASEYRTKPRVRQPRIGRFYVDTALAKIAPSGFNAHAPRRPSLKQGCVQHRGAWCVALA